MRRYTCMNCNYSYELDDPEFDYYRGFPENHWAVRDGLVQAGEPMDGRAGVRRETHGWFARCVDRERCDRQRRANHADQHLDQQELFIP